MTAPERWFTVDAPIDVMGEAGQPIGRLRPGKRYRALGVDARTVSVPGPNSTVGQVDAAAVRFEEAETVGPSPQAAAPAGWFPDPGAPDSHVRYWDGSQWTDHQAAADPSTSTESATAVPAATPAGWHPDPHAPDTSLRYWDGLAWTEHQSPR